MDKRDEMKKKKRSEHKIKNNRIKNILMIFVSGLVFFSILATVQFFILRDYLEYKEISMQDATMIILVWIFCTMGSTVFVIKRIYNRYEKPMLDFAEATKLVAEGDFSVYVEPIHSSDQLDYIDHMILDFNKMVEELGSIETLKTDFISNVSHEIKTPLSVIKNYSQYLKKEDISIERRLEFAGVIEENAKKLSDLITNILRLNKIENQNMKPAMNSYDLSRQIGRCIIEKEILWEKKNIEIEAEVDDTVMIEADEELLDIVWNNLISNAVKFTSEGGRIFIREKADRNTVTVSVSDTGSGIDERTLPHVFDKFYQGDTSHAAEGNGLGLALVKRIVDLHYGKIQVISRPEEGSTFIVTLPRNNTEKTI